MAWFVAIGMPVALFVWFSIAYFLKVDLDNPWVALIIVDANTLLWSVIALLKIRDEYGLQILKFQEPVKTLLYGLLIALAIGVLNFISHFWESSKYPYLRPYSSVIVFISFLIGSVLEEVIWRAYVLRGLGFGLSGLLVSSLFFGLHHIGLSVKNFVFATLAGLIFGYVYMETSLFWAVALGHVLYNLAFQQISGKIFFVLFKP